jgi:hypothetical protein
MELPNLPNQFQRLSAPLVNRRRFLQTAGMTAAAAPLVVGVLIPRPARADDRFSSTEGAEGTAQSKDTVAEIATAALIAEDLATTFYYNGLVGPVIQDPNLAGPGGTATMITSAGNAGNVNYLQAALSEEIAHANLLRSLLKIPKAASDPEQTFYFPAGTFDKLDPFLDLLDALENAFIGAYLNAVQEFATMAAVAKEQQSRQVWDEESYTPETLEYLALVSASIMGIESEHRVLGRVIANKNPANNRNYETTDGITAVYNGKTSAVAALTPFLTPSTGPGYSLATALDKHTTVSIHVGGVPPAA